jgi:hypothetical protein
MAQANNHSTISRFHNLSNEALADALGEADARLKSLQMECDAIKAEIKTRGVADLAGENFLVTVRAQFAKRLDAAAVRAFLGEAVSHFEITSIAQVIRVRAVRQLADAA